MTTAPRKTAKATARSTPYGRGPHVAAKASPHAMQNSDGPGSDDFEGMVASLHERFRRKTREQAARAEAAVRRAVEAAVGDVRTRVQEHDEAVEGQMARLRDALLQLQAERDEQVEAFRGAYHSMRTAVRAIIARISEQDQQLDAIIAAVQAHEHAD